MRNSIKRCFLIILGIQFLIGHSIFAEAESNKSSNRPASNRPASAASEPGAGASVNVTVFPTGGNANNQKGQSHSPPEFVVGSATVSGQTTQDPAFIPSNLRKIINSEKDQRINGIKAYKKFMMNPQGHTGWDSTIWGSQLKRFPVESLLFFVAIGAVNTSNLLLHYSENPLIMEQHLESLKDPIGNLSFLAFMVANGYAQNFFDEPKLTTRFFKKDIEVILKKSNVSSALRDFSKEGIDSLASKFADGKILSVTKKAYSYMIPYLSMTAGSMASHFTGDFLHTLQACTRSLGEGKDNKKVTDPLNGLSQDPCDVAWREWTVEKKFNTYAPAMASMMLSQAMASGVSMFSKEVLKIGTFEKMIAEKQAFSFKFLGFELVKNLTPGSLPFKAIRLVGHISNLTLFTFLDQLIHHWVEDIVLNVNYGRQNIAYNSDAFPKKAEVLYDLLEQESKNKYSSTLPVCGKDIQDYHCATGDILGFLHNFSETMTKWKDFNKTKPLMAHQTWLQMVNNFQVSESVTKSFYKEFLYDIQTTEFYRKNPIVGFVKVDENLNDDGKTARKNDEIKQKIQDQQADEEELRDVPQMVNYIKMPLYGIDPIENIANFDYEKWKNYYLSQPDRVEKAQLARLKVVATELKIAMEKRGYEELTLKYDQEKFKKIIEALNSDNLNQIGYGINLLRFYTENPTAGASEVTKAIFRGVLNKMGKPSPLMYQAQGFSFAFENNSNFQESVSNMVLPSFLRNPKLRSQFSFSKKTDYLFFHMVCGPQAESSETVTGKYISGLFGTTTYIPTGFQPLFIPPKLVKDDLALDFCKKLFSFKDSNEIYNDKIKVENSETQYRGVFQVLYRNFRPDIQELVSSKPIFNLEIGGDEFPKFTSWWEKFIEPKIIAKLNEFKEDYHEIAVMLFETMFKDDSSLNKGIMSNSIVYSNMQEARTYSLIISHVLQTLLKPEQLNSLQVKVNTGSEVFRIKDKEDVVLMQKRPYLQDFNALKNGRKPVVLNYQLNLEELLRIYHDTLKGFKIEKIKNSKGEEVNALSMGLDEIKINELKKQTDELIKRISKDIDAAMSLITSKNSSQDVTKAVAVVSFAKDQIERISNELVSTCETLNLLNLKVAVRTQKIVSQELIQSRLARAKSEKELMKKTCENYNSIFGKKGGCD